MQNFYLFVWQLQVEKLGPLSLKDQQLFSFLLNLKIF